MHCVVRTADGKHVRWKETNSSGDSNFGRSRRRRAIACERETAAVRSDKQRSRSLSTMSGARAPVIIVISSFANLRIE
jgi:hypothetical protein